MTGFVIGVIALFAVGLLWLAYCMMTAPLGHENQDGFHLGEPD